MNLVSHSMSSNSPDSRNRWIALAVILCAAFMALLDVFIVFVAAPSIAADLHASPAQVEWVVAGYGLAFALLLITGGRLGDMLGRRRVFRGGLALFGLGSALCGAAPTATTLIAARVLQGLGAAAMMPQVYSIIQVEFAPHERGRALGIMGAVQGAAAVGGQLIGGALIELDVLGLGWRTVFLVNLPIALVTLALAGRLVPESRADAARRLDLGGVALAFATVAAIAVPLVEGRTAGWPLWTFASLAAALPLGAAFVGWERRVAARGGAPVVPLRLFALAPFRRGVALALLVYAGLPGLFLVIAIYLQDGMRLAPLAAGAAFVPIAAAFAAASLRGARLSARARERLLAPSALLVAAGTAALAAIAALADDPSPLALAPAFAAIGAGQGIVIPGINTTVLAATPTEHAGSASGLLATSQQIGGALGVAASGTLFFGVLSGTSTAAYGDALAGATALVIAVTLVCAVLAARLLAGARRPRSPDGLAAGAAAGARSGR